MIREEEVYKIGTITKTHGISGELSMTFTDDVFDRVEAEYLVLKMDGIMVPFFMEEYRFKSDTTVLVKFEGIEDEKRARQLAGTEVFFPKAMAELDESQPYSWNFFVGFTIVDALCGTIGTVRAVDESTMNVLFEVESQGKTFLIPAIEDLIDEIRQETQTIYMSLPEGLLHLDDKED